MSLKAKLEAVIYAAEEPVTLAQLAVLFAGEALEWKAARDAEQAPALPLPAEAAAEAAAESLASPDEPAPESAAEPVNAAAAEPSSEEAEEPAAEVAELPEAAAGQPETEAEPQTEAEPDTEVEHDTEAEPRSEASVETAQIAPLSAPSSDEVAGEEPAGEETSVEAPSSAASSIEPSSEETPAPEDSSTDSELPSETAAEPSEEAAKDLSDESAPEVSDPNHELAAVVSAEEAEFEARRQERRRDREARETLRTILDELIVEYAADRRGIEIREIAGGYRMGTKPEMHDAVRAFVKSLKPPLKLSLPALETLAVIAYKQPVTAPEVGEIRGVDSAGVLGSLMSRKLIATAGRKQVVGRPMLYKTTREFLLRFGLKDISELPSMEEFEKMAAQELSEEIGDEAASQTGDLFAESETATVPEGAADEEPGEEAEELSEALETPSREAEAEPKTELPAEHSEAQAHQTAENHITENQTTGETPDEEEVEA